MSQNVTLCVTHSLHLERVCPHPEDHLFTPFEGSVPIRRATYSPLLKGSVPTVFPRNPKRARANDADTNRHRANICGKGRQVLNIIGYFVHWTIIHRFSLPA